MSDFGLNRDEVMELINENITSENLLKHSLATEAVIRKLAEELGEDSETWGLVGLAHDLDFDKTKDDPKKHTIVTADILREKGVPEEYVRVIISHNEEAEGWTPRQTKLEHALACSEAITGLVVATALVMPDKKLVSVKPKSVKKRMKMTAFARNVDRDAIMECEKLGVPIADFCALAVESMRNISDDLGL